MTSVGAMNSDIFEYQDKLVHGRSFSYVNFQKDISKWDTLSQEELLEDFPFLGKRAKILDFVDPPLKRWVIGSDRKHQALARLASADYECNYAPVNKFHCDQWNKIKTAFDIYKAKVKDSSLYQRLSK